MGVKIGFPQRGTKGGHFTLKSKLSPNIRRIIKGNDYFKKRKLPKQTAIKPFWATVHYK
jgi:hypothetical protein